MRTAIGPAAVALALVATGCRPAPPVVWTNADTVRTGQDAAMRRVAEMPRDAMEAIVRAERAVVRVRVLHRRGDEGDLVGRGSGALLAGGRRVVTVSHVLDSLDADPEGAVHVAFTDGRTQRATVLRRSSATAGRLFADDWAILELTEPVTDLAGLAVGPAPGTGDLVLAAHPDGLGRDASGRIVLDPPREGLAMMPVLTILRRSVPAQDADSVGLPYRLTVTAGAVPFGGASGGPVIDPTGALVALLSSVHAESRPGTTEPTWTAGCVPAGPVSAWLKYDAALRR